MPARSARVLLGQMLEQRYKKFILNTDTELQLPLLSLVPWADISKCPHDKYVKESFPKGNYHPHHLKFITKNQQPHAFIWQTNAETLKQGLRWGIVKNYSITGKVISSLGKYRIVAHERAMKGMVSNSQAVKLKLLDLYQDRFTALHDLESLVNKNNSYEDYATVLTLYVDQLQKIEKRLDDYFAEIDHFGLTEDSLKQIKLDINNDRKRALDYLDLVKSELKYQGNLRAYNRARGEKSILEFVKQQMIHGLYELQGINQDITYSKHRYFALTRGELNDFIEDARKDVDDHEPNMRNAVTPNHHGIYSEQDNDLLAYDFSQDNLSSAHQRQVLMAISFIERWDVLENKKNEAPYVTNGTINTSNETEKETLDTYAATRWRTHRNALTAIKSIGFFILNMFLSIFISTRSWEEESWENPDFHLNATLLRQHVPANEPMWKKPVYFFIQIGYALKDMFNGIRDFGTKLIIKMPEDLVNDWQATQELPSLNDTLTRLTDVINVVVEEELVITELWEKMYPCALSLPKVKLAQVPYSLSAGEHNDIINSMVRGLNSFSSVFTHDIYAKDPLGGLVFSTTYLLGIGMIYLPVYSASIFGSSLVNSFNAISYAMASSPLGASIAGGSTLAEASTVVWDSLMHGANGIAVNTFYQFGEDPLTVGAYFVAAYALGYFMANGIEGHQIPWLSNILKQDLGTDPSTGYPIIGAKFAVMLYEGLLTHSESYFEQPDLIQQDIFSVKNSFKDRENLLNRFKLVSWMSSHVKMLPELEPKQKFVLARQLDNFFSKEESDSLKKLLYPETHPSIAFQFFSLPLSYIPAIAHLLIAPLISLAALLRGHPYPGEPIFRAGEFLFAKSKKDLSRLLVAGGNTVYLIYSWTAALIKMIFNILSMSIGRVAGLFDAKPAHAMHHFFASVHNLMRSIGEFFYPARAMKNVSLAHPTDTLIKTESSYVTLLQDMTKEELVSKPIELEKTAGKHFSPPLITDSAQETTASQDNITPETAKNNF